MTGKLILEVGLSGLRIARVYVKGFRSLDFELYGLGLEVGGVLLTS